MRAAWSKKACVPGDFSKSSGAQKSHRQGDSWKGKDDWTSSYHATEQFASLRFVLEKRFGLWALISVYLYIHTYIHTQHIMYTYHIAVCTVLSIKSSPSLGFRSRGLLAASGFTQIWLQLLIYRVKGSNSFMQIWWKGVSFKFVVVLGALSARSSSI